MLLVASKRKHMLNFHRHISVITANLLNGRDAASSLMSGTRAFTSAWRMCSRQLVWANWRAQTKTKLATAKTDPAVEAMGLHRRSAKQLLSP